jgi:hypothetical protein
MHIALPYRSPTPDRWAEIDTGIIMNSRTRVKDTRIVAGADVQAAWTEMNVELERVSTDEEVAVCIPSEPGHHVELTGSNSHYLLTKWWEEWRHNIAVRYGGNPDMGPLFLVLEKRQSDQFTNCYYQGGETETKLNLSGEVSDIARLALRVGFHSREIGSFGFKSGRAQPGQKWAIFISSGKMAIIWHKKFKSMFMQLWQ